MNVILAWMLIDTISGADRSFGISIALSRDGRTVAIAGHLYDDSLKINAGHVMRPCWQRNRLVGRWTRSSCGRSPQL